MNKNYEFKEIFNKFFFWPLLIIIASLVLDLYLCMANKSVAFVFTLLVAIAAVVYLVIRYNSRENFFNKLVELTEEYGHVQNKLIKEIPFPYILLDEDGYVFWMNDQAKLLFEKKDGFEKPIGTLIPEIDEDLIDNFDESTEVVVTFEEGIYLAHIIRVDLNSEGNGSSFSGGMIGVFLYDQTEYFMYKKEVEEQKMVVGLIYLDNYDETLSSMEDVKSTLLAALLERKINKYCNAVDGIVRKMDKDKFMVVLTAKNFNSLQDERFKLLSDIKLVNIGDDITVTISMGFGIDARSYTEGMEFAKTAIELALGRGGDQAVIKSPTEQIYYGGSNSQTNRNTRVKARVKAQAFRELVIDSECVFIMGHQIADVDSFGAAIGFYRALLTIDKKVRIIINEVPASVKPFMDMYTSVADEIFVDSKQALSMVNNKSVVVVVDVNKPSLCECSEILSKTRNIAVFDHHRQGTEVIRNAVLAYIEPYASSTCEMVTEMLQYIDEKVKLKKEDADSLYAGIVIDTNNFMTKTGVRTFEASAYLRRNGADVTRVRMKLREDMDAYRYKAQIVLNTEVYKSQFAIGICANEELKSPTVIGAQAANELLNIIGIQASFVLTPFRGKIYVSARSEDLNVQTIMEHLGGGGHINTAGTQITDCTVEEAKQMIREELDQIIIERNE